MWEGMFLRAWVEGRDLYKLVPTLAAGTVGILFMMWGAAELSSRVEVWTTRKLKFRKRSVQIVPGKPTYVSWKDVFQWTIEPTRGHGFRKLSMEYRSFRKARFKRTWSMLLNAGQVDEFLKGLRELQQSGLCSAGLIELSEPAVPKPRKQIPPVAMWFYAIAYALFVHGLPFLFIGIFGGSGGGEDNRVASESFKVFITTHFSSVGEMRTFYATGGALFCVAGLWAYRTALRKAGSISDVRTV
jgi:hypothetical protein